MDKCCAISINSIRDSEWYEDYSSGTDFNHSCEECDTNWEIPIVKSLDTSYATKKVVYPDIEKPHLIKVGDTLKPKYDMVHSIGARSVKVLDVITDVTQGVTPLITYEVDGTKRTVTHKFFGEHISQK